MTIIQDQDGVRWRASIISHGKASGYLHRRLQRPIVEFECLDRRTPRRYTKLPVTMGDHLDELGSQELEDLFSRAKVH